MQKLSNLWTPAGFRSNFLVLAGFCLIFIRPFLIYKVCFHTSYILGSSFLEVKPIKVSCNQGRVWKPLNLKWILMNKLCLQCNAILCIFIYVLHTCHVGYHFTPLTTMPIIANVLGKIEPILTTNNIYNECWIGIFPRHES